jgi:hypothetical protein
MEMKANDVLLFININSDILKIIKIAVKDDDRKRVELTSKLLSFYQDFIGLSEKQLKKKNTMAKLEEILGDFYKESLISRYRYQKMRGDITRFRSSMKI